MAAYLLRKEPFGGIAAMVGGDTVRILSHAAFAIFGAMADGAQDAEILTAVKSSYPTSSDGEIQQAITKFRGLIAQNELWDSTEVCSALTDVPSAFPILSYPLDLTWEITRRCNQFCQHCYNNSSTKGGHPTWEQLESVLNELKNTQLRNLTITGGEPLLRKDFRAFAERIKDLAFDRTLSSNGTLVTDRNIDWLSSVFNRGSISIDVADKVAYEEFRGLRGSFARCLKGIALLRKHRVEVVAQTTLSRYNINLLEDLAQLLIDLEVRTWSVRLPFQSGRAVENTETFLSRQELLEHAQKIDCVRQKYLPFFDDLRMGVTYLSSYSAPYGPTENKNKLMSCTGATIMANLNADGRLSPCALFAETDFQSDPVWDTGLKHQWQTAASLNAMRTVQLKEIDGCGTCSNALGKCGGGCRAQAYLAFGTIYKPAGDCNYSKIEFRPREQQH